MAGVESRLSDVSTQLGTNQATVVSLESTISILKTEKTEFESMCTYCGTPFADFLKSRRSG